MVYCRLVRHNGSLFKGLDFLFGFTIQDFNIVIILGTVSVLSEIESGLLTGVEFIHKLKYEPVKI